MYYIWLIFKANQQKCKVKGKQNINKKLEWESRQLKGRMKAISIYIFI